MKCLNYIAPPKPPALHPCEGKAAPCSWSGSSRTTTLLCHSASASNSCSRESTELLPSQSEPFPGLLLFWENSSCWWLKLENMTVSNCQRPCPSSFRKNPSTEEENGVNLVTGRKEKRREIPVSIWNSALFLPLFKFCVEPFLWFFEPISFHSSPTLSWVLLICN